jgi:hypothetical protein
MSREKRASPERWEQIVRELKDDATTALSVAHDPDDRDYYTDLLAGHLDRLIRERDGLRDDARAELVEG